MFRKKQTKRNLVVVLMALAVVAGPATGWAMTVVTNEVQVTNMDDYDVWPTLGVDATSEFVVYTSVALLPDGGYGPGNIMCQRLNADGTTIGEAIKVSEGTTDDRLNDVSGPLIVYSAFLVGTHVGQVKVFDLNSWQTEVISGDAAGIFEARICGTLVAWIQGEPDGFKVMCYDLAWGTSLPVKVGGPTPSVRNVDIGERFIVWEEEGGGMYQQGDIKAYDYILGTTTTVSNDPDSDERQPATSGNWVVWQATTVDGMTIELADISDTPIDRYTAVANHANTCAPSIDADLVAYYSDLDGNWDIFLYRISDGAGFQITTQEDNQWLNNLFGDKVAYVDDRNASLDIYVSTFELPVIIFVDASASGGANDGSSWADAYNYLQDALAEATSGDTILVAAGTYTPDPAGPGDPREATFQLASGVAIYGGFPSGGGVWDDRNPNAYETILSGDLGTPGDNSDNSYHVVTGSDTDETAVLDGFTITAGNANGDFQWPDARFCGGGMYNEYGRPTVTNCTFSGNTAGAAGGGMYNYRGSPTVNDCTFSGNSVNSSGGGMYNVTDSNPTVNNCIFSGNSAGDSGGGMHNYTNSSPILTNCSFIANSAHSGGGLDNYNYSSPTLTNCSFSGNEANSDYPNNNGGGMSNCYNSSPTMTNCIFSGNSANDAGGAMFTWASCILKLSNCTFSQNSALNGKALACDDLQGGQPPSTLEVNNCILWDGGDEIWNNDGSTITINYSDVEGGYVGTGNIDADPLFDGDVHLLPGSPCIDAGDNTAVPTGVTTDLDGNPRFMDDPETTDTGNGTAPIVDMGAYEFPKNTPTGTDVIVQPFDVGTATRPLTVAFEEVTEAGVTSLTTSSEGEPPPSGFKLGDPATYYDLSTTATYNGDIEVCIDYSGISFVGNEEDLRLYHYESGAWIDATVLPVDTENNIICGIVNSLSAFAIFEPEEYQPPVIGAISAPLEPVQVNTTVEASASFWDPDIFDTHTAVWDWGDSSTSDGIVYENNGIGIVYGSHNYTIPGVYTVTLTLTDAAGASDEAVFEYIVAYDPSVGFVTGGGWIYSPAGALLGSTGEGKASFGFVAKYKKGATTPQGNTEFRFQAGDFRFKSSSYEWLVVAGRKAMFKGEGSIDGMDGSFKFMLTGVDDTEDKFRIKIWDPITDMVIYDNKRGEGDDVEPTVIGGGSIVIHQQ